MKPHNGYPPERDISSKIEVWKEAITEECEQEAKIIDIYADYMRQTNHNRFQTINDFKDAEIVNAGNDYDNFLTP